MPLPHPFLGPPDQEHYVDIDDAEGGPDAPRVRRRRAPTLREDGLAMVAAGAVRLESARRGISQQQLALELNMSRTAVSARFTGQVPWSLDQIGRIAQCFGCRIVDLVVEAPNARGIVPVVNPVNPSARIASPGAFTAEDEPGAMFMCSCREVPPPQACRRRSGHRS